MVGWNCSWLSLSSLFQYRTFRSYWTRRKGHCWPCFMHHVSQPLLGRIYNLVHVLGCVYAQFAKAESAFWNADSKRRSPGCCLCSLFSCSRKSWFREHALRMRLLRSPTKAGQIGARAFSEVLNSGYCLLASCSCTYKSIIAHCAIFARAGPGHAHFQVNRKGVYMTSFKRDYNVGCVYASPELAFCTNHVQKRTFLCVLNQRFETAFIRKWVRTQPCFALITFENADFGPKKLSINAPKVWIIFWVN